MMLNLVCIAVWPLKLLLVQFANPKFSLWLVNEHQIIRKIKLVCLKLGVVGSDCSTIGFYLARYMPPGFHEHVSCPITSNDQYPVCECCSSTVLGNPAIIQLYLYDV
jgi:hypothetical protein